MTEGFKSSEFFLSVFVALFAGCMNAYADLNDGVAIAIIGLAGVYSGGRSIVKRNVGK